MKNLGEGIVLSRIAYSESSWVIQCFTREHGLKSFLVQGGKKKYASQIQALSHIEFSYSQKHEDQLARMYEIQDATNQSAIRFDPVRSSICFFEAEFVRQCVHEGHPDLPLYDFLCQEIQYLSAHDQLANYVIYWVLEMTRLLGFQPQVIDDRANYFDLQQGELGWQRDPMTDPKLVIEDETVPVLAQLLKLNKEGILQQALPKAIRQQLLEHLLRFMRTQHNAFREIKSLAVYQTLWYE